MAMTWAQRLKRVFNIDIETCEQCQGPVRIIACIEDPVAIKQTGRGGFVIAPCRPLSAQN